MIKLGTHNSLSYLPCQWYLRPFQWIGKCQSKDLLDQYKLGVRYFDIRLKYLDSCPHPISGHGLLTYDINIDEVMNLLNSLNDVIYVRLFLENSKFNPEKYRERFKSDIRMYTQLYSNLIFIEGGSRYNYIKLINFNSVSTEIKHAEYWRMKFCIPYPKRWAKKHNPKSHESDNEFTYNIYDYIQY